MSRTRVVLIFILALTLASPLAAGAQEYRIGFISAITGPGIWAAMTWFTGQTLGLPPAVGQGIAVLTLLVGVKMLMKAL